MSVLLAGVSDEVAAAVSEERSVRRVATLSEARDTLAECDVVLVDETFQPGAETLLDVVRTGVYCPATMPVVHLVSDPADRSPDLTTPMGRPSEFDAVVEATDLDAVRSVLSLGAHAAHYRDAVSDLYEACRANAATQSDQAGAAVDEALEEATRAFEDVREAAGRTPYEQLLGSTDADALEGECTRDPSTGEERGESGVTGDGA